MSKGLLMKYFVLKPSGTDIYAKASRLAMRTYADVIYPADPQFSLALRSWAEKESRKAKK